MIKFKHKKKKNNFYFNKNYIIVQGKLGKIKHKVNLSGIYIIKENKLFINKNKLKFFKNLINNLLHSVNTGWQKQIKIEGKGFKLIKYKGYLSFDLGYSNLFLYKNTNSENIKLHQSKYKIILFSKNLDLLNKIIFNIKNFYYHDKYHNKGIFTQKEKKIIFKKLM